MTTKMVKLGDVQIPESVLEAAGYSKKTPVPVRFRPISGQAYWCTNTGGRPSDYFWQGDGTDKHNHAVGNCFATEEEAISSNESQLALVRVQDKLAELATEPLGWGGYTKDKWFITYNHKRGSFYIDHNMLLQSVGALYGSKEACESVISSMGRDLRTIIGIE